MRPFGHTEAREERKTSPVDTRLQEAWERIVEIKDDYYSRGIHRLSLDKLLRVRPSLDALHHLIMATSLERPSVSAALGLFVSAGYQLAPEREIVYELQTPTLHYLGAFLQDKHLIITGSVGCNAGHGMIGRLTNNGVTKHDAGREMVGILTNNGFADRPGEGMVGVFENHGTIIGPGGLGMLGDNRGSWNIQEGKHDSFLADIMNPRKLDHGTLSVTLKQNYRRYA
jgi:hypothetical protein